MKKKKKIPSDYVEPVPIWAQKKKNPRPSLQETMGRKTAAEINTNKVDSRNQIVTSHLKRITSSKATHSVVATKERTKAALDRTILSPAFLETKLHPFKPGLKPFPASVVRVEKLRGCSPPPRYEGGRIFENSTKVPFVVQTRAEADADSLLALQHAAKAKSKYKRGSVLNVEPVSDKLFSPEFLKIDMSKFPLAVYDAPELYRKTDLMLIINEQNDLTKTTTQCRGFSPYRTTGDVDNVSQWMPCIVLTCMDDTFSYFRIRFVHNGQLKTVHRLRLRFEDENEAILTTRIASCKQRQRADIEYLRWRHFLKAQVKSTPHCCCFG